VAKDSLQKEQTSVIHKVYHQWKNLLVVPLTLANSLSPVSMTRAHICKPFMEPRIDSELGGPVRQPYLLYRLARARICKCLKSPGIDSEESIPPTNVTRAGISKQSMGARNRAGIGLSYRPTRLHRLAEFIPLNRFLSSINF
jgi:hypothetical protein